MRFVHLATASALSLVLTTAANAATFTIYTDRTAFLAAAGQVSVQSFEQVPDQTISNGSADLGGFTLTDAHSNRIPGGIRIGGGSPGTTVNGTRYAELSAFDAPELNLIGLATLTFDTGVRAFGANFASGSVNLVQLKIGGESFVRQVPFPNGFFGVISDEAFAAVTVTAPPGSGTFVSFDNVTFSSAAVPEPASWALMIAGFAAVGAAARRRTHPGAARSLA